MLMKNASRERKSVSQKLRDGKTFVSDETFENNKTFVNDKSFEDVESFRGVDSSGDNKITVFSKRSALSMPVAQSAAIFGLSIFLCI